VKLEILKIENLRAIKNETIAFGNYNCFVGANGSGKSTVLTALNILFRQSSDTSTNLITLEREDFHAKDTSQPIRVSATFVDLSAEAQADFSDYYRQGKLIITAVAEWDAIAQNAPVKQMGQRTGMLDFAPFFKELGDGALVEKLKTTFAGIRLKYPVCQRRARSRR
jgi:putative ATP-dependent endonuclease of OLD family